MKYELYDMTNVANVAKFVQKEIMQMWQKMAMFVNEKQKCTLFL
jgi:hypothetical protein